MTAKRVRLLIFFSKSMTFYRTRGVRSAEVRKGEERGKGGRGESAEVATNVA